MPSASDQTWSDPEQMLEQLRLTRERIAQTQQNLAGRSESVTSKDRMVTAVVNAAGELTELKFNTTRYRQMAPAELGAAICEVIEGARSAMAGVVRGAYAPLTRSSVGGGFALRDVVSGRVSAESYFEQLAEQFEQTRRTDG